MFTQHTEPNTESLTWSQALRAWWAHLQARRAGLTATRRASTPVGRAA